MDLRAVRGLKENRENQEYQISWKEALVVQELKVLKA